MKIHRIRTVLCLLVGLGLSGCAMSVKRTGYSKSEEEPSVCNVKFFSPGPEARDRSLVELGTVSVKDGGFTFSCSESDVLQLIRSEVCSQGGNLAMIVREQQPDLWSSCYRAQAEILKTHPDSLARYEDAHFGQGAIDQRSQRNSATQTVLLVGAIVGGFVAGFLLTQ